MAAIVTIIERNGPLPGVVTQNIKAINWVNVDDNTTPYTSANAAIALGFNSFTKYDYIMFSGGFTSLGNVTVTYLSGTLPAGVQLMTSPSITLSSSALPYAQPTTTQNSAITPYPLNPGKTVNLLVGPSTSLSDPAMSSGKTPIANNIAGLLFTNYFVSQLQTSPVATTGTVGPIVLQISYDEV